ncbi:snRNA-activating protein complex subunit 4 isoform X2 [Pogoniulus pusillus]|uniref:snRNA-activating protein complex subunit 4 isoform X2 n=1 Tax=Pogoniulus pusillus TaxID=488313 RepID=UPI0030B9624F
MEAALPPAALDLNAEREKIRREIEELERSLEPGGASLEMAVSDSSLSSATDDGEDDDDDLDSPAEMEMGRGEDSSDDDIESSLPQDPETCLQINHVYQEVIQEKLEEVELLLAQNREQQKELTCELSGPKIAKAGDGRNLPANIFLGHFMKPYFKDKTTGIGPPSNEDTKEKAAQGIKSFEQLISTKWKSREKTLLQKSIVSDRLQRLLQPKLLKMSYWNQKLEKVKTEVEKQILEKQIKEVEQEIEAINKLPESDLLGSRFDEHDWEKISNIHFDGQRSSDELRKFWQNWEHPSINKKEWTEKEIQRLKEIASKHRCLDWQTIAQELGTNRTPFQCLQEYQVNNKDLKRKEWTRSEDQMLLELVQKMRVGSHIPYKKIAYYMEGRDSAQLIYRWTKSVDPSLKKGPWTAEEDAMLLAAVKKYGERDWYKIRTEVPGRSDAQCRDRYLKALHYDVKKGRWTFEEEEQLIELVQKHGLGHWSKIASELPHRTSSQCLSKWKLMIGSKNKCRPTKRQHVEESSSSSESSSEDVELDLADSSEEETTSKKKKPVFPSIDLWVPTWTDTQESKKGRYQTPSLFSPASAGTQSSSDEVSRAAHNGDKSSTADKSSELNTLLRGIARPHSTDIVVKNPAEVLSEASRCGKQVLRVTVEDVRRVLRRNTFFQGKLLFQIDTKGCMKVIRERRLKQAELVQADTRRPQQASQNVETSSGNSSQPGTQRNSLRGIPKSAVRRPAVSESSTPATQGAPPAQVQRHKPKTVSELLREKRLRESQAKKATGKAVFVTPQVLVSGPLIIQSPPQQIIPSAQAGSKPGAVGCTNSQVQCVPAPLPAFTSVAGSTSTTAVLENHSSSVPESGKNLGSSQGTEVQSNKEIKDKALESSSEGGANPAAAEKAPDQRGCNGQVLAGSSAPVVLQNQAFVPHQITVMPVGIDSGTNKLPVTAPVACKMSRSEPQQRPVNLLPAVVTPQTGSHLIPNNILPFTWVVMPQALLPTAVQTVVGVPQGLPAAAVRSPCRTTVTSSGSPSSSAVPPVPAGANLPQPSSAETKAGSAQPAAAGPLGRAANHSTALLPVTSASPGCATAATVSSAAATCSGGFSKTSDSPAAQTAPPADAPSLCAVLLPQPQLSASAQGTDSQGASNLSSLGKSHDSSAASNPSIITKGIMLQPGAVTQNSVPRNSNSFAARAVKNRPIASKPPSTQPADAPAQPTTSSAEKNLLDFSLISLEAEGLVKEWLSGKQGVHVPPLQTRLPYLPPFLCNLKTLSKLLLQKAALEEQAASLLPSGASQGEGTGLDLQAIGDLVQQKLGDNPAYLLLKARFLAAFTLPAVLATLPPPKMMTTLSTMRNQCEESDEEEWQSEKEASDEESDGNESAGEQSDGRSDDEPRNKDADLLYQGMGAEENAAQSALGSCTEVAAGSAPLIRRSARLRKRRRI